MVIQMGGTKWSPYFISATTRNRGSCNIGGSSRTGCEASLARERAPPRSVRRFSATLRRLYADGGYQGPNFRDGVRRVVRSVDVEIVKRSDQAKGFTVLPKRWIVERTIAWLNRCRRLAKDRECPNRIDPGWALRPSSCEQKEAKNFTPALRALGVGDPGPPRPTGVARRMKSFARFFSKNAACLLIPAGW
jgi:transposase